MLLYKVKPLLQYFAVFFVEQRPSLGSVQTHLRLKIWKKININLKINTGKSTL